MAGTTIPKDNPHLRFTERAPYELGRLLVQISPDASSSKKQTDETYLIADATSTHASNGIDALMQGLEGIGRLLFSAADNDDCPVDTSTVGYIGTLITHLAVELQHLYEIESNMDALVGSRPDFQGSKGGVK